MLTYFCWLVKTKMRKIHVSSNKLLKGDWTLSLEISEYVSSSWSDVEHGCHIFLLLICSLSDLEFRFTFWGFTFWLVLFWGCLLWLTEKAVATHSSTLAWKIPWTEEPGRLQSTGSRIVRQDWATSLSLSCIGEGNGNPLQCSCLENPRDRGAWWADIYEVAQSQTRQKRLSSPSTVAQIVKNLPAMWETQVWSLGQEDPPEKGMETHSSIPTWKILWTEGPVWLQSMGLQRVGHDWATNTFNFKHYQQHQYQ